MASTTLNTFLLQAPSSVFSVEILGSWDNFCKAYQLKRDRRTGPGHWRGCHTFENITCDGDTLDVSPSREGGLKMGGTYWYYYLLDGDVEYYDPAEPSTNFCPLLPGQVVNVLDVPVQSELLANDSHNDPLRSVNSMVFTLDPKDKYLPQGVRRAATTSAIQARRASFSAASSDFVRSTMKASDGAQPTPPTSNLAHGGLSSEKQFSPRSFLHRIRQTKSADSSIKSSLPWPRKISSRAGQAVKVDQLAMPIPDISKAPSQLLGLQPMSMGDDLPIQRPSTSDSNSRPCSALTVNLSGLGEGKNAPKVIAHDPDYLNSSNVRGQEYAEARATPLDSSSKVSLSPSYFTPLEQPREDNSFFTVTPIREETTSELYRAHGCASDNQAMKSLSKRSSLDREPLASNAAYTLEGNYEAKPLEPRFSPGYGYAQFSASYATDDFISPCLESNTTHLYPMSPCHLSQPKTPIKSETGDDFLSRRLDSGTFTQLTTTFSQLVAKPSSHAPPPPPLHLDGKPHRPHAALEGFQGYSVPENAQASALTIRKLPSTVNKPANDNLHFAQHGNKHDLVHSWTNGPEHRMSVLKELVDDLGYLGAMII